jgi:hypothetical protein
MNKLSWYALLLCWAGLTVPAHAAEKPCPKVSGHYRVAGFGPVLGDALTIWGAEIAGSMGSEVKITGDANQGLSLFLKIGNTGVMSSQAVRLWHLNRDYRCEGGWVVFNGAVPSSRQGNQGWLEGKTELRIARDSSGGLAVATSFSGRQRTTLYSYDSARISIPKLGTGQALADSIRFPNISEPPPASLIVIEKPEPKSVTTVRQMLTYSILGNVMVGWMEAQGDAVLVTLTARDSEAPAQFEDRLRAALIAYEMKRAPIWSNNSYNFTMLIQSTRAANQKSIKLSANRVLREMQTISHPMVYATGVIEQDDEYLATLQVLEDVSAQDIITRLKRNSSLVTDAQLVREFASPQTPKLRIVELRVRLR